MRSPQRETVCAGEIARTRSRSLEGCGRRLTMPESVPCALRAAATIVFLRLSAVPPRDNTNGQRNVHKKKDSARYGTCRKRGRENSSTQHRLPSHKLAGLVEGAAQLPVAPSLYLSPVLPSDLPSPPVSYNSEQLNFYCRCCSAA